MPMLLKQVWVNGVVYSLVHDPATLNSIKLFVNDPEASYLLYSFNTESLTKYEYQEFINLIIKTNLFFYPDKENNQVWFFNHSTSELVVVSYNTLGVVAKGKVWYNNKNLDSKFPTINTIGFLEASILAKTKAKIIFTGLYSTFTISVQYDGLDGIWREFE